MYAFFVLCIYINFARMVVRLIRFCQACQVCQAYQVCQVCQRWQPLGAHIYTLTCKAAFVRFVYRDAVFFESYHPTCIRMQVFLYAFLVVCIVIIRAIRVVRRSQFCQVCQVYQACQVCQVCQVCQACQVCQVRHVCQRWQPLGTYIFEYTCKADFVCYMYTYFFFLRMHFSFYVLGSFVR